MSNPLPWEVPAEWVGLNLVGAFGETTGNNRRNDPFFNPGKR